MLQVSSIGEYCSLGDVIPRMLSTMLKYLAWCFASEALETKLQILNTMAKVILCTDEDIRSLQRVLSYAIELVREEKLKSFSRRRKFHEERDFDSINDRNEHFNKKIERAFGKYTLEIKNNLEQGIALPD